MKDPRLTKLTEMLVNYSTEIKPGENVLLKTVDLPPEVMCSLIESVSKAGGNAFPYVLDSRVNRQCALCATEERARISAESALALAKQMDAYIIIGGNRNSNENSDVPDEINKMLRTVNQPVSEHTLNNLKWVCLAWPSPSMAQKAGTSTEAFEDFYFKVCTLDYAKMAEAVKPLCERMERADRVRIIGPLDTDITFSIKGMPAVPCVGKRNVPDGEVYTAPVIDSANGVMHYNTGTSWNGKELDDVRLVLRDGKIIEATGSDTDVINSALDTDEGARYIGEFSFGINPHIKYPMRNTLFDEKADGSFHFTPGRAYEKAPNGNKSKIHWDMVAIQRPDFGGGKILFDDELIREDGRFVPDYLQGLNPENLI